MYATCVWSGHGGYSPFLQLAATRHKIGENNKALEIFKQMEKDFPKEAMVYLYQGQVCILCCSYHFNRMRSLCVCVDVCKCACV